MYEQTQPGRAADGAAPEVLLLASYVVRPDADTQALSELWEAMHRLVTSDPGFGYRGATSFAAGDGSRLVIYRFASLEGLQRFGRHPEHVAVQRRGGEFFEWLRNEICTVDAVHPWSPVARHDVAPS